MFVITKTKGCIPGNKTRNEAWIFHWAKEALETVVPRGNSRYSPRSLIVFQYVFTTYITSYTSMAGFTIIPVSHTTISTTDPISHTVVAMAIL